MDRYVARDLGITDRVGMVDPSTLNSDGSLKRLRSRSPEYEKLPMSFNPEVEAFRKQTELNHALNLSHGRQSHFASAPVQRSMHPADKKPDYDMYGDKNPRKRGRPTKRNSPSPSGLPSPQITPNALPKTHEPGNEALKTVIKALPTVRDHTTDQLGPEGDEYIPREYDEAGEKKVTGTGHILDGREYRCRTFLVPNRGDKLFMLATECARVLGYRDSYLLFNKNRSLYKIIATQAEKDDLIHKEILPYSYRSRQIAIVTAKSMFRQFGSRVIINGRRVRDDYWERMARKQGFTEEDLAGERRPGAAKARDAAAAEASSSVALGYHGDIVYATNIGFSGSQTTQSEIVRGLPTMTVPPRDNYSNIQRPRQEIMFSPSQDLKQAPPPTKLLQQTYHAAEYNKQVNNQQVQNKDYLDHRGKIEPQRATKEASMAPETLQGMDQAPSQQSYPAQSPIESKVGSRNHSKEPNSPSEFTYQPLRTPQPRVISPVTTASIPISPSLARHKDLSSYSSPASAIISYLSGRNPHSRANDILDELEILGCPDELLSTFAPLRDIQQKNSGMPMLPRISLALERSNEKSNAVANEIKSPPSLKTLPSDSSSEQDSLPCISDDETEYSTDGHGDSLCNDDLPNDGRSAALRPALSSSKQSLVDCVMAAFWKLFQGENRLFSPENNDKQEAERQNTTKNHGSGRNGGPTNTSTSSTTSGQTNVSVISPSNSSKGKQKRDNDDRSDEGWDDHDRGPKRPRTILSPPVVPGDRNKMACPYRKYNPGKYRSSNRQWRSCALTPLDNVARVKGHLYRHHMIYPCPRCKELFKNQEGVGRHLNEAKGCEQRNANPVDGITNEIVEQLKPKRKAHRGETEEEKWRKIYMLLFPGGIVPSPYFEQPSESTELEAYEEYCRRELPRIVRATVEEIVNHEIQPIEAQLISQLESIIRNSQQQVYTNYRSAHGSHDSSIERSSNFPPQRSAPLQFNTPIDVQRVPISSPLAIHIQCGNDSRIPLQANDVSAPPESLSYASEPVNHRSTQFSQPPPFIGNTAFEDSSYLMASSQAPQAEARTPGLAPFQGLEGSQASSSTNDHDWTIVPDAEGTMDSSDSDPNDFSWVNYDQGDSDEFNLDNYWRLGGNNFKPIDKTP